MTHQQTDIINALDQQGVYIWAKPLPSGQRTLWAAHVLTDSDHRNIGCYDSRAEAIDQAIIYAKTLNPSANENT